MANIQPDDVSGWLVASDRKAFDHNQLDKFHCLPGENNPERARLFWRNAKNFLLTYCGGFRKNLHLYLREAEFRNNMNNTSAARAYIETLIDRKTTTATGEKNA